MLKLKDQIIMAAGIVAIGVIVSAAVATVVDGIDPAKEFKSYIREHKVVNY